jgi:hypothetical protein
VVLTNEKDVYGCKRVLTTQLGRFYEHSCVNYDLLTLVKKNLVMTMLY